MSFTEKHFIVPNLYHTLTDGYDGYAFVTGIHAPGDGYQLLGMIVENTTGSTVWAQVFDGYAQPSALAVPLVELQIAANTQASLDLGSVHCIPVSKGIVIAGSSTRGVYTAAAASMWMTVFYI